MRRTNRPSAARSERSITSTSSWYARAAPSPPVGTRKYGWSKYAGSISSKPTNASMSIVLVLRGSRRSSSSSVSITHFLPTSKPCAMSSQSTSTPSFEQTRLISMRAFVLS